MTASPWRCRWACIRRPLSTSFGSSLQRARAARRRLRTSNIKFSRRSSTTSSACFGFRESLAPIDDFASVAGPKTLCSICRSYLTELVAGGRRTRPPLIRSTPLLEKSAGHSRALTRRTAAGRLQQRWPRALDRTARKKYGRRARLRWLRPHTVAQRRPATSARNCGNSMGCS